MGVSNVGVAAKAIPVLITALVKHLLDKKSLDSVAQRECLSYHESFAVVKGVLEDAMDYTIECVRRLRIETAQPAGTSKPSDRSTSRIRRYVVRCRVRADGSSG